MTTCETPLAGSYNINITTLYYNNGLDTKYNAIAVISGCIHTAIPGIYSEIGCMNNPK